MADRAVSTGARIREATEADLPRLVALLAQLSPNDERELLTNPLPEAYGAALAAIRADPRQRLLVLEVDGRIVASLVFGVVPNVTHQGRPWAFVENVVVDEAERGKRHGETLMRWAVEEARKAGCYKLTLTSNKGRAAAHRFYRRLGFENSHEGFRMVF